MKVLLTILAILLATSCYKADWAFFHGYDKKKCTVEQFVRDMQYQGQPPYVFKKTFDPQGTLTGIEAYFYNYSGHTQHARLTLSYRKNMIYLINLDDMSDTTMKIFLNYKGRVAKTVSSSTLIYYPPQLTTLYTYSDNRLDSISYVNYYQRIDWKCYYDQYGNILGIQNRRTSPAYGLFYTYDYSRKASGQLYADGIESDFDNTFNLLRFLDLFPELNPVHLRTEYHNGNEGGAYVYHLYLTDHVLDASGRLVSYLLKRGPDDTLPQFRATLSWKCDFKK